MGKDAKVEAWESGGHQEEALGSTREEPEGTEDPHKE